LIASVAETDELLDNVEKWSGSAIRQCQCPGAGILGKFSKVTHMWNSSSELMAKSPYDVVIVGGGTAGIATAISAARRDMSVCLVEQTSMLGGMGTSGMMTAIIAPKKHFGGVGVEIVDRLRQREGVPPNNSPGNYGWVPYHNETMKRLLDDLILDSGVDLYLCTKLIGVQRSKNTLQGITVAGPDGNWGIRGSVFVDATGDGALSCYAGEDFELGDEQGNTQAPSMTAYYSHIDFDRFSAFVVSEGGNYTEIVHRLLPIAVQDGILSSVDLHHPGVFRIQKDVAIVNVGHVYGADCASAKGLTMATIAGRKLATEYIAFYRRYIPGFENAVMTNTASWLGIRETRRIKGKYMLSHEDKANYRKFDDAVFRFGGGAKTDMHASTNSREDYLDYYRRFTSVEKRRDDDYCSFPYRSLVTGKNDNLYVLESTEFSAV
jgi:hypothetical protein